MTQDLVNTLNWLAKINENSQLKVSEVSFEACRNWQIDGETMRHETVMFFSVVGLRVCDDKAVSEQHYALIDQPEVGWLGFLVRQGSVGIEWLVQAKTEPGNISATQMAPTIQATRSNYRRVHGGKPTKFLDLFENGKSFLSDGPHSEQGTQFLWKFNRNSVLALPKSHDPELNRFGNWNWITSTVLRILLAHDYTINTDARSVIATGPWLLLAGQEPLFSASILATSYRRPAERHQLLLLAARIKPASQRYVPRWEPTPLNELIGWEMNDYALLNPQGEPILRCYEINVKGREVANWCQPFILQDKQTDHVLYMRTSRRGAEFFLRIYEEVGFGGRREYGPSLHSQYDTPEEMNTWSEIDNTTELCSLDQSDEGGRFMAAAARYRIVLTKNVAPRVQYPFGVWVNLAVLEKLANSPGHTTNELRTLISLVLSQPFDDACANLE